MLVLVVRIERFWSQRHVRPITAFLVLYVELATGACYPICHAILATILQGIRVVVSLWFRVFVVNTFMLRFESTTFEVLRRWAICKYEGLFVIHPVDDVCRLPIGSPLEELTPSTMKLATRVLYLASVPYLLDAFFLALFCGGCVPRKIDEHGPVPFLLTRSVVIEASLRGFSVDMEIDMEITLQQINRHFLARSIFAIARDGHHVRSNDLGDAPHCTCVHLES